MKNYGKLGSLVLLSAVIIGGFYTKNALAETSSPEYTIETRSGDAAYIENMVLLGNISNKENTYWDFVQMSKEETKATENFSFNERLDGVYAFGPEIQRLYRDYPDFLRNKRMTAHLYHEDEFTITYANSYIEDYELPSEQFEVAVLDKASDKENQLLVDIPEYDRYDSFYIEDVQKNGEELLLFTTNYFVDPEQVERHVYRVDLKSESVIEDRIIEPISGEMKADYTSVLINSLSNPQSMKSEQYLVYESNLKDEQDAASEGTVLLAYDTLSGELDELAIPDELKKTAPHQALVVHESSLYYTSIMEDGFGITRFDIEENAVAETQFIDLPGEVMQNFPTNSEEGHCLIQIADNVIYYISGVKEPAGKNIAIVAGDLETGQVLYDGAVVNGPNMGESFKDNLLYVEGAVFR